MCCDAISIGLNKLCYFKENALCVYFANVHKRNQEITER